jgi:tetratricopeptide (TPR) repeat protein
MTVRLFIILQLAWCGLSCGGSKAPETTTPRETGTIAEGEMLIEKGDFEGAAAVFKAIAAKSPDNAKAQFYLGVTEKNLGNPDAAVSHYESAIHLDGQLMDAHINLGLLLLDKGDLERAESELGVYLEASPDASDAHFNYGLVQEAMGNLDKAGEHYKKAMSLDPEDASPLFGLGDLERSRGNLQAAIGWYEKARALNPEEAELVFVEGQTLLEMKKPEKACDTLSSLLDMSRVDLVVVSEAGKLIAKEDAACAIKLYEGAIAADDTFAAAHFYLANTLAREKKFKDAKAHYARFLELAPDDPAAGSARKRLAACEAAMK